MASKSPLPLDPSASSSLCAKLVPTLTCFIPVFNPATVPNSYIPNSTNFWPTTFSNQIPSVIFLAQNVFENGLAEFQTMSDNILHSFLPPVPNVSFTNMTEFSLSEYIQPFPPKQALQYSAQDVFHSRQFFITPTSSLPPISPSSPQIYRTVNPTGAFEQLIIPTGLTTLHKDGIEYSIAQTTYPINSLPIPPSCAHRALQLKLLQLSPDTYPNHLSNPSLPTSLPSIEFPSLLNNTFINMIPQNYSFTPPDISFINSSSFDQFCFPKVHSFDTLFATTIPSFTHFKSHFSDNNRTFIHPDFIIPFSVIYVDLLNEHSVYSFYLATLHLQTWRNTQLAFFPTNLHHNHINSTFPSHFKTETSQPDGAQNDYRLKIIVIVSNAEMMDRTMLLSTNQIMELGEECDIDFLLHYQPTHSPHVTQNKFVCPTHYQSAVQLSQFIKQTMLNLYLNHHHTYNPQNPFYGSFNDELCFETFTAFVQQHQDGVPHLPRNYDQSLSIPPKFSPTQPLYLKIIQLYQTFIQAALPQQNRSSNISSAADPAIASSFNQSSTQSAFISNPTLLGASNAQLLDQHKISIHELTLPIICIQEKNFSEPEEDSIEDPILPSHSRKAGEQPTRHVFEHFLIQQPKAKVPQKQPSTLTPIFSSQEQIIPFHDGIGLFHARQYKVSQSTLHPDLQRLHSLTSQTQSPTTISPPSSSLISPNITRYCSQNDPISSVETFCYRIDHPTHQHHSSRLPHHMSFTCALNPMATSILKSPLPYSTIIQSHAIHASSSSSDNNASNSIQTKENNESTYHHVLLDQYPHWYLQRCLRNQFCLPSLSPQSIPAVVVIYYGLASSGTPLLQLRSLDPYRFKNIPIFLIFVTPASLFPQRSTKKISNSLVTLPGSQNDGLHTLKSSPKLQVVQSNDELTYNDIDIRDGRDKEYLTWFCAHHKLDLVSIHRSFHFLRRVEVISFLAVIFDEYSKGKAHENPLLEVLESTDPMEFATTAAPFLKSITQLLPVFNKLLLWLDKTFVQFSNKFKHDCSLFDTFYTTHQKDIENAHQQAIKCNSFTNIEYFQRYYSITTDPYRLHYAVLNFCSSAMLSEFFKVSMLQYESESKLTRIKQNIKCIQRWIDIANKYVNINTLSEIRLHPSGNTLHDRRFYKTYDPMSSNSPITSYKLYQYVISEDELQNTLQRVRELALVDYFTNYSSIWGPMK